MASTAMHAELTQLARVAWILLIPAGVLLSMVLYKLFVLLQSLLEFLTVAKHELTPALRDVRLTAEHVETLSSKAMSNVRAVESGASSIAPILQSLRSNAVRGVGALWQGIQESFRRV